MPTSASRVGHAPAVLVRPDYAAGVTAGLAAGAVLSVILMAQMTFLVGFDPWAAAKMSWSLVAGPEVIRPGFEAGPVLGGLAVHFGLSAIYGFVFAWLAAHNAVPEGLLGAMWGAVIYLANIVVIPAVFPRWAGHVAPPNLAMHALSLVEHVIFGVVLAAAYRVWSRPALLDRGR
jgi:hypothetical protein